MFDYTIEDAQKIIKSFDSSNLIFDNHVLDNWFEREISFDYIFHCLKYEMLLGITKTSHNRFKLIYHHKHVKTKDLYIVVEINDDEYLRVITAYSFNKRRREREHEGN